MPEPAKLSIHLLCMHGKDRDAYLRAAGAGSASGGPPPFARDVTIHECALAQLPASVRFDAVVSPANSYGRLDGAFDDALSRALSPADDYLALTRAAQAVLYREHRGWANPGSCTRVALPPAFAARSRNVWGVRHLLLCPTMRVPDDVTWDREIVYQCVWNMLCAIDRHNREVAGRRPGGSSHGGGEGTGDEDDDAIRSVLMTPLATGVGRVSEDVWAAQLLLALRHFDLAVRNPDEFAALDVDRILTLDSEIQATYEVNLRNGRT
ncbi:phage tail assembly-like protein [Cordyceps javanica]|uniref:Phage tail assembly-like protein n=1 Tax=Cordyceps javanica TaxID=43265 RepID=A0A545V7G4_9HYPO|nr:phage tail assembly-like protein [Cordyceps javanica]TQW09168.1 phage tail assembly-like protein [Cordyceps javanica]